MPPKKRHPWQKPWKPGRKQTPVKAPQKAPKIRKVFVTLEVETDMELYELRRPAFWSWTQPSWYGECLQAQVNVARK